MGPSPLCARTFWLLLVVAALIRIGMLAVLPEAFVADPDDYRRLAQNVLEHGVFGHGLVPTAYRPPAYPILLVPCVAMGAGTRVAIGSLHVVLGLATVGLALALARRAAMGTVPAALAAGLVAADPILLAQSAVLMSETLAALLMVLAVYCLDRCWGRPETGNAALAGAALGALVLCRPGLLAPAVLVVALLPWLALHLGGRLPRIGPMHGDLGEAEAVGGARAKASVGETRHGVVANCRPAAWQVFVGLLGGLIVIVAPWMVRNQLAFGRPMAATTHGGYTLLLGNNPFYYDHLRRGRWFHAWQAEPFHAWWRRELLAEGLLKPPAGNPDRQSHRGPPPPLLFRSPEAEVRADALAYRHAFASMRMQPGMFARSCLVRAGRFWSPVPYRLSFDESPGRLASRWGVAAWYSIQFALAAAGMWFVLIGNHPRRGVFLWSLLAALALTAVHTCYWSNLRMRAPLVPLIALVAMEGAIGLQRRFTARRRSDLP